MAKQRRMTAEELAVLRNACQRNAIMLDGVDSLDPDDVYGNGKTAEFVDSTSVDDALELIEFIITAPDEAFFSPAQDRQRHDGSFGFETDAWVVTFSATSNRAWQGFQPCLARPQVEHA